MLDLNSVMLGAAAGLVLVVALAACYFVGFREGLRRAQ